MGTRMLILSLFVSILTMHQSIAQEKTVSGTVTSSQDGLPLPGVNVLLQGTNEGVQTDFDGKYSLQVSQGDVLQFSFIGFQTVTKTVGNQDVIDVSMVEDLEQLDDVVVTAYGIKKEAKKLGYSIQTVEGDDISDVTSVNVTNALSGKATGVQINQNASGVAGSTSILIRGITSLSPDNNPLIVIDGVIVDDGSLGQGDFAGGIDYGNALSDINPDEVASVNILKGGNATALYGYRGANGVVVITTKNGTTEKVKVDFSTSLTVDNVLIQPKFQNEFGQGRFNRTDDELVYDIQNGASYGPRFDGSQRERFDGNGTFTYSPIDENSFKNYFRTGHTTVNTLAISQAKDRINYRFAYSYLDNKSIQPNSSYNRHNFSLKVNGDLSDKFKFFSKIDYIRSNGFNRPELTDGQANSVKNLSLRPRSISNSLLRNNVLNEDGEPNNWNGGFIQNPYYFAITDINEDHKDRYIGLLRLDYSILNNLTASLRISQDQSTFNASLFQEIGAFNISPDGGFTNVISTNSIKNYDLLFNYDSNLFSDDISLNATLGFSQVDNISKTDRLVGQDILVPGFFSINNFAIKNVTNLSFREKNNSVFGSLNIGYKNIAFVEITGRNDWSSTLPIENASFFYPSIGGSLLLSELAEMNSDVVSLLKLRGSYAVVGNAASPFSLRNTYNISSNTYNGQSFFFFGLDEQGAGGAGVIANENLEAELSTTYEFGIDAQFFNNRLGFDITYYNSDTENQILNLTLPPSLGASSRVINAGLIRNNGLEIALNAAPIRSSNFSWDSNVNFSLNRSEIVELDPQVPSQSLARQFNGTIELVAAEGEPYGDLVGSTYVRDDNGNIVYGEDGLPLEPQGVGKIGNITPDFLLGWQNTFSYKNFELRVLLDSKFGGDIFSFTDINLATSGNDERTLVGRDYYFGGQGIPVPENATIQNAEGEPGVLDSEAAARGVAPDEYWTRVGQISEQWVYDASFIKLREVALTYQFKRNWLEKINISSLSLSYIGRNLAILHKNTPNFDPETGFNTSIRGIEYFGFPSSSSHGLKLNVSF